MQNCLNLELIPDALSFLLKIFEVIDKLHCFLIKTGACTTVINIKSLYFKLNIALNLANEDFLSTLNQLRALCPTMISLEENSPYNTSKEDIKFFYIMHSGIGNVQCSKRRSKILESITIHAIEYYMSSCNIKSSVKSRKQDIKRIIIDINTNGWPSHFDPKSIPCPSIETAKIEDSLTLHNNELNNILPLSISSPDHDDDISNIESIIKFMKNSSDYKNQISHIEIIPSREGVFNDLALPFPAILQDIVANTLGIKSFYSHQALAINAIRAGKHVSISTSTSSGKSAIYNLPVLEAVMNDTTATSLYLFPTKALAQDQFQAINRICCVLNERLSKQAIPGIMASVCDGDTSYDDRKAVMTSSNIVLTNPDMLHFTLLPDHSNWSRIFRSLKYVVIDEAHHYRGGFGAHVAAVMRRLIRVCLFYGSRPQFICCSATIANPKEHMLRLIPLQVLGQEVVVIDQDGSPRGCRHFLIWNPPLLASQKQNNKSTYSLTQTDLATKESSLTSSSDIIKPIITKDPQYSIKENPADSYSTHVTCLHDFVEKTVDGVSAFSQYPNEHVTYTGGWKRKKTKALQTHKTKAYAHVTASPFPGSTEDYMSERSSSILETSKLFSLLAKKQVRTIAFCGGRKLVELVLKYSLDDFNNAERPDLVSKVASYRGGYNKEERRMIERDMFSGNLLGITATCALELGIDIGNLDCTLHLGFPGSYSSLWQQAGRAGRSKRDALSVMICFDSPLDQFLCANPAVLFRSPPEPAIVDTSNVHILRSHILCAALECPLNTRFTNTYMSIYNNINNINSNEGIVDGPVVYDKDIWGNDGLYIEILEELLSKRYLTSRDNNYCTVRNCNTLHYLNTSRISKPSRNTNLRVIDPITIKIIDASVNGSQQIDSIGYSRAFFEAFEGAIYLHRAKQYMVSRLDLQACCAFVKLVHVNYYTSSKSHTRVNIVKLSHEEGLEGMEGGVSYKCGSVQVVSTVHGYSKHKLGTGEVFESGDCSLPPLEYNTRAFWIDLPLVLKRALEDKGLSVSASLHAVNHALAVVACLFANCDVNDVATEHIGEGDTQTLRMLVYDKQPGALGIADKLFEKSHELISRALDLLALCGCEGSAGCSSCLLDRRCTYRNNNLSKLGAVQILKSLHLTNGCNVSKLKVFPALFLNAEAEAITTRKDNASTCGHAQGSSKGCFGLETRVRERSNSPRKRRRQILLKDSTLPDLDQPNGFRVQSNWTDSQPDFHSDYDLIHHDS